ncbi:Coq4 family protein [Aquimarina sediminis]|uniref:Coq4 family protein n=1 Tax=Aquimarina sediminis TaxID=2070536 RepID=UPI000CA0493D|nr:Coq4 family protein [Aquimarina sediminis]
MRAFILETIYNWSKKPYQRWFKKNPPWDISIKTLLKYPKETLGFHLGCFLLRNNFSPQPKLEDHDVFHVLTNIGITVSEEIAMQYYLLGNGKHSIYQVSVIFLGTLLYPDKIKLFKKSYRKGKAAYPFHQLDYKKLLHQPVQTLKTTFLISSL